MMYPEPTNIWESIEYSSFGLSIAESLWAFPTIETIHVIALVTVLGTIMVMDLRILGWASKRIPVTVMSNDTLKWTWLGFGLAAITGTLMFISKASTYMANPYFLWKMGLLVVVAINMLIFHFMTYKSVHEWNEGEVPTGAKVAGLLSLIFWVAIVFVGRAIGFTLGVFY